MLANRFSLIVLLELLLLGCFAQELKITHGPYLQAISENEVTIVWTTNKKATSWVELAENDIASFYGKEQKKIYEINHGIRHTGTLHRVKVKNLKPGTTYKYRICSQSIESDKPYDISLGKIVATDVFGKSPLRFKTLDSKKPSASVYVINDIHGNNDKIESMLREVKFENTDAVIFNGDMIDYVTDENTIFSGFMDQSVSMFASEVPVFFARGNHETRGPFKEEFPNYFPTNEGSLYYRVDSSTKCNLLNLFVKLS